MTHSVDPIQGQDQVAGQVVMYEDLAEIEKRFEDIEVNLRKFPHFLSTLRATNKSCRHLIHSYLDDLVRHHLLWKAIILRLTIE